MSRSRLPVFLLLAWLACITGVAHAATHQIGGQPVDVPEPAGFVPIAAELPELMQLGQNYLPTASRLLEIYVEPADLEALKSGGEAKMANYYQLVVARTLEGVRVTPAEFKRDLPMMRSAIEATLPKLQAEGDRLAQQGNERLQDLIASEDAAMKVADVESQGFFREQPWGLFFTVSSNISVEIDGETESAHQIGAAGLALVGEQILFFYAYADTSQPDASRKVKEEVVRWVEGARAANGAVAPAGAAMP